MDLKNPVCFRETEEVDLDYVLELEADPDTAPFIAPWPRDEHRSALADPTVGHWVLEDVARRVCVGFVILQGVGSTRLELKRIAISDKGRGYGKDAVRLVKQAAYKAEGFTLDRSHPAAEAGCAEGTAYIMGLAKP